MSIFIYRKNPDSPDDRDYIRNTITGMRPEFDSIEEAKAWLAYLNVYGNELKEFGFEDSEEEFIE